MQAEGEQEVVNGTFILYTKIGLLIILLKKSCQLTKDIKPSDIMIYFIIAYI